MSREALASAYTVLLTNDALREEIAQDASVLEAWELTDDEKNVLIEEAGAEVSGFAIGSGHVMDYLSGPSGPPLSPSTASSLGVALNLAAGLPTKSLSGPGFAASGGCCPWNKSFIA
jgi:hypothetical protein